MNNYFKIAFCILILLAVVLPSMADSSYNFENPPYTIGNLGGQDGWSRRSGTVSNMTVTNINPLSDLQSFSGTGSFWIDHLLNTYDKTNVSMLVKIGAGTDTYIYIEDMYRSIITKIRLSATGGMSCTSTPSGTLSVVSSLNYTHLYRLLMVFDFLNHSVTVTLKDITTTLDVGSVTYTLSTSMNSQDITGSSQKYLGFANVNTTTDKVYFDDIIVTEIPSAPVVFASYDCNQGSGLTLTDTSGNGHNGTITSATWTASPKGYALKFDGINDKVDLGMIAPFSTSTQCSFTAWIKLETAMLPDTTTNWVVFSSETYPTSGSMLRVEGYSGKLTYRGNPSGNYVFSGELVNRRWHHVALVKNADTTSVFLDGILQGSSTIVGPAAATVPFTLSCLSQGFVGQIDEVALYANSLSSSSVMSMYKQDAAIFGKDTSGFGKIKIHPYLYYDDAKLIADVDFTGILPMSSGQMVTIQLIRSDGYIVETRNLYTLPVSGRGDYEFALGSLANSDYHLTVSLKDSGGNVVTNETYDFHYPYQVTGVVAPSQNTLPVLPVSLTPPAYSVTVAANGGINVIVSGQTFPVESYYSYPTSPYAYNRFTCGTKGSTDESVWSAAVTKVNNTTYTVVAHGVSYRLERTITLQASRIVVNDKIINLKNSIIGLIFGNSINGQIIGFDNAYLGGNLASGTVSGKAVSMNPTAFLSKTNLGIGLFAQDDVYTVQSKTNFNTGKIELFSDSFALNNNANYTLEWTIYPSATGKYYDFINQIRKDENRNATIDGGMGLNSYIYDGATLTDEYLVPRGIKYLVMATPVHILDDPGISLDGLEILSYPLEKARLTNLANTVRGQYPDLKVMFHVAHSLYATNNPSATMPDSAVKNADGSLPQYSNGYYYFSPERIAQGWTWRTYFATPTNSLGALLMTSADVMVDDMHYNAVFMDGFGLCYGADFIFNQWDYHTADINSITKAVIRTKGSPALLQQDSMVAFARKMNSKGASVIANGFPVTRTLMNEKYIIYDSEIVPGPHVHLANTPAALASPDEVRGGGVSALYDDILDKLKWGNLFFYYGDVSTILTKKIISAYMYPLTFEEIYSGYVKGTQRLVTSVPGLYGWNGDKQLHQIYFSDARGVIIPSAFLTTIDSTGARTQLDLRENEIAVVRKIPVSINSSNSINVGLIQYDSNKIIFSANGIGTFSLNVKSEDFNITANNYYKITAGSIQYVKAGTNGELNASLFLSGSTTVTIEPYSNTIPDVTPPTVTINQSVSQSDPTTSLPIKFSVVFSEPVTGFSSAGISLSGTANPTIASITGIGNLYEVAVIGMTNMGTVIASVNAGAAMDIASNLNTASTSTDNMVIIKSSGYVATGKAGVVGINIYQANGLDMITYIDSNWEVNGISFAPNGDLYFTQGYQPGVYKCEYLGSGFWDHAILYNYLPISGYLEAAFNLGAKSDGTVYVGTYASNDIFKMTATSAIKILGDGLTGNWGWWDFELSPDGVSGEFWAQRQQQYIKNYNANGTDGGFISSTNRDLIRGMAFGPSGKLYARDTASNTDILAYDPNNANSSTAYIHLWDTNSNPSLSDYVESMAYGPDFNGDSYGDFYVKHTVWNGVSYPTKDIRVYSGAPGLSAAGRYLGVMGSGYVGIYALDSYIPLHTSSYLTVKVNLADYDGDITTVSVVIELNGIPYTINLDSQGNFTFFDIAAGTYDVRIKALHWLAKLSSINVSGGTVMDPVTLINGDVIDNNEVDFSDINAVRAAYGSFPGDESWNDCADVNGSGEVDFTDINIVRSKYGEIGD